MAAFLEDERSKQHDGVLLHEFETLAGVPDVVFLEPRGGGESQSVIRQLARSRAVTNGHANVLASLHKHAPRRIEYLARSTGLAPNYVRRIVADLRLMHMVEVLDTGSVVLADDYSQPSIQFTALEFKLTDWRRALAQAIRHRSFAATATVVMPASREASLRSAAQVFREYGVGSAVFDSTTRHLKYVVKPRVRTPTSMRIYLDAVGRAACKTGAATPADPGASERSASPAR